MEGLDISTNVEIVNGRLNKPKKTRKQRKIKQLNKKLKEIINLFKSHNLIIKFTKSNLTNYKNRFILANNVLKKKKISKRPTKEELEKFIWELPAVKLKEKFNCSDSIITRWCKIYGIEKPGLGYWAKLYSDIKPEKRIPKEQLEEMLSRMSNAQAAKELGCHVETIREWQNKYRLKPYDK